MKFLIFFSILFERVQEDKRHRIYFIESLGAQSQLALGGSTQILDRMRNVERGGGIRLAYEERVV